MGETGPVGGLSDAAGRPTADRLAARPALKHFWRDERGATAIEYGLMIALIALALVGIMTTLTGSMKTSFQKIVTTLNTSNAAN
jgi:pilus assembly protein Flp/PilA